MIILALDTTTPAGSVAVARGHDVVLARRGDPSRPHGERLPGDLVAALDEAGVALRDVALYVVARGPGAFTGLRIGIAAIQGLAFASRRPVAGVSALDAIALAASKDLGPGVTIGAWMDAARHEVFAALYEMPPNAAGARLPTIDGPSVGRPDAILDRWRGLVRGRATWMAGEGVLRYRDAIAGDLPEATVIASLPPLASALVPIGLDAWAKGEAGPPHAIRPLYVRRPDAEIARDRRVAGTDRDR